MKNLGKKISSYEDFINDRLKKDLKEVETLCSKKVDDYKNWQELQNFIKHVQNKKQDELITTFEFGFGVYMAAKLERVDKLIVCIGCNCYLEMYYDEANKYVELRMKYLKKEINFLRQQAVKIKAHIKLVLLAISELKENR
ncbi:hypothetical protein ILUMI_11026 [Ignelater luminosus]|uniref:Uncharacterized protein n=1 Tax=Ignelater luminosus TaxID=2038154 RepID=A0A8K0D2V2_IGNLU|nr:hypothetical protein ILUMI_11026 [Ignelater luminosus]